MQYKAIKYITLLSLLTLAGCSEPVEEIIEAPKIICNKDIVVTDKEDAEFKITDFCEFNPANSLFSLNSELDLTEGEHEIGYTLTNSEANNFSTGTLKYKVEHYIPPCQDNATYDEELEACVCDEGYVDIEDTCEVKAVCKYGYAYNSKTNTCYKVTVPVPEQQQNNNGNSNNGGGSTNNGGNSNGGGTNNNGGSSSNNGGSTNVTPSVPEHQSGEIIFSINGNSQEAIDEAFAQCDSWCTNFNGSCECRINGDRTAYIGKWSN